MLLAALPRAASADAVTYASGKRTLRVGILLVDSTIDADNNGIITPAEALAGPENPDPYVFQIADQRKDVKPLGWEFVNPLAPRTVTQDVLTRWTARDPNNPYQLGANITKDMAAYWEVSLSKTAVADLIQFDALLLTTHRLLKFSPADREKLRKLVDAGGLLWLDDCGGMRMSAQGPFFLEQLQFQGSRGAVGSGTPVVFQPGHALLNSPYRLSLPQIALLGEYTDYRDRALAAIDPVTNMDVSQAPNPSILTNVVGNLGVGGGLPYIATASYGSGTVVATCGDTGCAINDYVGGTYNSVASGPNSGAYMRGARLERAHEEDLLFLYNLTQLGAANNTYRRNNRRVGTSGESLRAPLTTAFDFTQAGTPTDAKVNSASAPLVARDRVYVSGIDSNGQLTVRCYNAKPSFTRGDQGVPDLAFGAPYDEVWRSAPIPNPSNRQPSSPVLGTVFQGGGSYRDYLFVTTGDGSLIKLDALPTDNAGNPLPLNTPAGNPAILKGSPATYLQCKLANGADGPAPAPVFHENRVYVVQPDGVVRCIESNTMVSLWTSIDVAITPNDVTPTGSPTLGVVRLDDLSGGNRNSGNVGARSGGNTSDIMLYVPAVTKDNNGNDIAKILPFWLGTRHEVIENPSAPGDYNTRVAVGANALWIANTVANPLPYFIRPKARVYDNRANMDAGIENGTYTNNVVTDAGLVQVRDGANNPPPPGTPLIVSVDYDLLYVPVGPGPGVPPGLAAGSDGSRPSGNGPALLISDYMGGLETTALGPDDVQFFAARANSGAPGGGRSKAIFLGAREQFGIGATKLRQSFNVLENVGDITVPMDF